MAIASDSEYGPIRSVVVCLYALPAGRQRRPTRRAKVRTGADLCSSIHRTELDVEKLCAYIEKQVKGFQLDRTVYQFSFGQSFVVSLACSCARDHRADPHSAATRRTC